MHRVLILRTITPLHVGTGQAIGTTDLPIAREKSTDWPIVPGSGVKGVLKDDARIRYLVGQDPNATRDSRRGDEADQALAFLFGSPKSDDPSAGALAITDLRCLLFPVRSLKGTYAYATCPLALQRAAELKRIVKPGFQLETPSVADEQALVASDSVLKHDNNLLLEGLQLSAGALNDETAKTLESLTGVEGLSARLAVLPDDLFTFLVKSATEVTTHVTLEFETRTAKRSFLRSEERVPAEAVFVGLLMVDPLHASGKTEEINEELNNFDGQCLQFGGKASVGNGLCRVRIA